MRFFVIYKRIPKYISVRDFYFAAYDRGMCSIEKISNASIVSENRFSSHNEVVLHFRINLKIIIICKIHYVYYAFFSNSKF